MSTSKNGRTRASFNFRLNLPFHYQLLQRNASQNLIMAKLNWKTLQHTAFQVLWCSASTEKRPAPLQMRPFTLDSYKAIKERERRKKRPNMNTHPSRRPYAQTTQNIAKTVQLAPVLELSRLQFAASEVASALHSGHLQREELAIQDYRKNRTKDDLRYEIGLPGAHSASTFEGRSSGELGHYTSLTSPAMSANIRVELGSEQFHTPHSDDRTSLLCNVQTTSSYSDEYNSPL